VQGAALRGPLFVFSSAAIRRLSRSESASFGFRGYPKGGLVVSPAPGAQMRPSERPALGFRFGIVSFHDALGYTS